VAEGTTDGFGEEEIADGGHGEGLLRSEGGVGGTELEDVEEFDAGRDGGDRSLAVAGEVAEVDGNPRGGRLCGFAGGCGE
jgi:hypothetical protein